ncbi:MAG: hypothetical protein FD123_2056 [Bacteroidetes bacterium]|nr:MAG: hypothetical protein FD123_2056 [Bacteroidota bacterium]
MTHPQGTCVLHFPASQGGRFYFLKKSKKQRANSKGQIAKGKHSIAVCFLPFAFLFLLLLVSGNSFAQSYWVQRGGGLANDEAADVSSDAAGNLYYTGYYSTTASFGTFNVNAAGITDVFLSKTNAAGVYQWAVSGGGTGSDRGLSVKADAAGNSYITGFFYNTATFSSQNVISAGQQDVFVAKYDPSGTLLWLRSGGGTGADIGNGITVDNSGNVIITGEFAGTASFGSQVLTSMNGTTDVFTVKYDASGNVLWAEKGSAHMTDRGLDVSCDATGNVFITGQFSDTITFDQVHLNNMVNAVFVVKYDPNGVEQWFRRIGGGAVNIANSITCDVNNKVLVTGDFQGTLTFFGTTNSTLSGLYSDCIFLARYDNAGNLDWSTSAASTSQVTSVSVTTDASANTYITGLFKCRFTEYSDQYGTSTFNSVGFWDIFVAQYNSTGAWQWSRQLGGKKDESMGGIALTTNNDVVLAGAFGQELFVPYVSVSFLGYNVTPTPGVITPPVFCGDNWYNDFAKLPTSGATDAFMGRAIDLSREPYDFYYHQGSGCNRDSNDVCIISTTLDYGCFGDTISVCEPPPNITLHGATQTSQFSPSSSNGPDFTYLWSTGSTQPSIFVNAPGMYAVTITSADGCITQQDTIILVFNPDPPLPTISDDELINVNDTITTPIILCADSVVLTGGNLSNTYSWVGPNGGDTSAVIIADTSGYYTIMTTNQFGCSSQTTVLVTLADPFDTLSPQMLLLEDTDGNDSISICDDDIFTMFIYDSITNPNALTNLCIEYLDEIQWTVTPAGGINYTSVTNCVTFTMNNMNPDSTGTYTITGMIIRASACDTDTFIVSHTYYIEVLPVPQGGQIPITITGNTQLCPGDTTLLVASGAPGYNWSTGSTNDSIYVSQPGTYTVSYLDTVTNSFGCDAVIFGNASIFVTVKQPPTITMNPGDGVICPNDSVLLVCTGVGTFIWQGPNGPIGGNVSSIYVTSPGFYYCVLMDNDSCQLVSNTLNIVQYNTPYLQAIPSPILCNSGDTVAISVISNSASLVQWQAPLSGSALTQYVTQPGTYTCLITSCGIVTPATITVNATQVAAQASILGPYPICEGDSTMLIANTGQTTYSWNPGNFTGDSVWVSLPGTYTLVATDQYGCSAQDTVSMFPQPNNLVPPIGTDTTVCIGQLAELHATGQNTIEWYTQFNGGSLLTTGNTYLAGPLLGDTTFYLVTHTGLCRSASSVINVDVVECPITIPNVFTPNGDGNNDNWTLYIPYGENVRVRIYNRWGQLIYEFSDLYIGWDGTVMQTGKPASDGVYYYIAEAEVPSMGITQHTGFLHLIRAGGK